jgi:hypothetical protein
MTSIKSRVNTKMQAHVTRVSGVLRDFSHGRLTDYACSNNFILTNFPGSVSNSYNVNFDEILGSGKVRYGTTPLGAVVATNKNPLGLAEFTGLGGTPKVLLSVFKGASNSTLYYFDTSWHASGLTTLNNSSKVRFAVLGGRSFMVNGVDAMKSSSDGNTWDTTNCITAFSPSLIYRYAGMLIVAGVSGNTDRIYFSSVVDLALSPTLAWNTDATAGDWIDINPDDGDNIIGFIDISGVILIFKNNGFYRLDVIQKSVDPELVYDQGAPSQEAITKCQGNVYYFSGGAIYETNGGYPTQISRLGVQDFIDAIPQANWSSVCAGADTFNVYFSIGEVTVNGLTNYVVLKFSTRDQSWSVHYYPVQTMFYSKFTNSDGRLLRSADNSGYVQTINKGQTDNGTPIFYTLETQEQEFASRASEKEIQNKIAVFTRNGQSSKLEVMEDDADFRPLAGELPRTVSVLENLDIKGKYIKFKWSGVTSGSSPVFEGIALPEISDHGVIDDL